MEVCGPVADYHYRKVGLFVLRCAGLRARSRAAAYAHVCQAT